MVLVCFACSDGDLTIENIDFENGTVDFCPLQFDQMDTERTLFFKTVEDEALILDLQSGLIENEISTETITSNLESQSILTYRLFSENISDTYFCSDIPPVNPSVLEETTASSGIVNIVTSLDTVTTSTKTYAHNISFTDLTILGGNNERITNEPGLDFGTYSTTLNSSVNQTFSNYSSTNIVSCPSGNDQITLSRFLNDELIVLEFPSSILINEATSEPRTISLGNTVNESTAVFANKVFNRILATEDVCTELSNNSNLINTFTTVSGTFSISSVEDADSTPENPIFNHTLTLNNFDLQDANGNTGSEIESYVYGTVTTTTTAN